MTRSYCQFPLRALAVLTVTTLACSDSIEGPSDADPTPPDQPCSAEGELVSNTGPAAVMTFRNARGAVINIYWLDYQGARVAYFLGVEPGQSRTIDPTYLTHPWLAASASGACVGIWLPTPSPRTVVIG